MATPPSPGHQPNPFNRNFRVPATAPRPDSPEERPNTPPEENPQVVLAPLGQPAQVQMSNLMRRRTQRHQAAMERRNSENAAAAAPANNSKNNKKNKKSGKKLKKSRSNKRSKKKGSKKKQSRRRRLRK